MVRILAASSLHRAVETLSPEEQKAIKEKGYSNPGLSLNIHAKYPQKIMQNLIRGFKYENELIIWHDVTNNTMCTHKSNFYRALSVSKTINKLESYQNRIRALVYCQRNRTTDIFSQLKETNILVFSIEKEFISLGKQKDLEYLKNLKALQESPDIELNYLDLVLEYENDLLPVVVPNAPPNVLARR